MAYLTSSVHLGVIVIYQTLLQQINAAPSLPAESDRFQVLRIYADSKEKLRSLQGLQHTHRLDPWRSSSTVSMSGDYMSPGNQLENVLKDLQAAGLKHDILIPDVHRYLQENDPLHRVLRRKRAASVDDFRYKFLPYSDMFRYLEVIRRNAENRHIELGSLGTSFEGRRTPFIKISRSPTGPPKPMIFIDGGVHSREWISPAMVLEIIHRLAINSENDTSVDRLLDHFDWLLVPLVNPDGYQFTFHPNLERRLWRKSRATTHTPFPACYGVDLNRNFGFQWNDDPSSGGSSDPGSGTYSGPSSFSEPESRNLRDALLRYSDRIRSYLTLHSFGQFFLYPWGFSSDVSIDDEMDLQDAARAFADTMRKKNYNYNVGGSAKMLYPASGGSDDYVRGTVGVKYAYTVELPPRETSVYGFLLPETEVRDVVTDTWTGLKDFFSHVLAVEQSRQRDGGLEQFKGQFR